MLWCRVFEASFGFKIEANSCFNNLSMGPGFEAHFGFNFEAKNCFTFEAEHGFNNLAIVPTI